MLGLTFIAYHGIEQAESEEALGIINSNTECTHEGIQEHLAGDNHPMAGRAYRRWWRLLVAVLRLLRRGSGRSGWGTYLVCCLAGGGGLDEDILGVHNSVHILLLLQQPV